MSFSAPIILASRSPRRIELLSLLVPRDRIVVQPPLSPDEPGFDDCRNINEVERRILEIARLKREAVRPIAPRPYTAILSADSTIIAESAAGEMAVFGQPQLGDAGRAEVRRWFEDYYFVRPHIAMSAVSIETADGRILERVAATVVSFSNTNAAWLDWYIASGESSGRAGGYAIQERVSMFVDRIEGSLTNIVGLPLEITREMLIQLGLI
jgi:septum formation protein